MRRPLESDMISVIIPIEKFGMFAELTDRAIADTPNLIKIVKANMEAELIYELRERGYVQHGEIHFREADHYPQGGCNEYCPAWRDSKKEHRCPRVRIVDYGIWAWVRAYKRPTSLEVV